MDQKKTEKLMETEIKIILDSIQSGIVIIDAETHRIIEVNPIALKMIGAPEEKIIGAICHKYICPAEKGQCPITDLGQKVDNSERVLLRANGDKVSILKTVTIMVLGGRKCLLENFVDITERKRAEEALREVLEYYTQLINSLTDVFFAFDKDLKYTHWNTASEKLTKISAEDAIGKSLYDLFPNTPQTRAVEKKYREVLRTGQPQIFLNEYKIGGKDYYFEISAYPLKSGISVFTRDITERKQAEEALRETSQYLESLFDYANAPIIVWDPQFKITRFNHAFETLTGRSAHDVIGKSIEILFPTDKVESSMEFIRGALEGKRLEVVEINILHLDGAVRTVLWNSATLFGLDGKTPVATIAQGQDITERKQAEEALRASETRYRLLVENLPQKIFLKDRNLVYISCNENYARDLKIEVEEIKGKTDFDFYPKELAEKYRTDDKRIMEKGEMEDIEEKYIQDGKEFFVHTVKTPTRDEQGNVIGILGIFWDITERKKMEEKIKVFSDAITGASDYFLLTDLQGNITYANESAIRAFGYTPEEFLGLNTAKLDVDPETGKKVIQDLMAKGKWNGEVMNIRKNKEKFPSILSAFIIKDEEGNPKGMMGIIRDITERKKVETLIKASEEKYRSLVQNIPDVVWTTDQNGRTAFIGSNVKKIYGYTPEEIIEGGDEVWFGRIHPDDIEIVKKTYIALFEKKDLFDIEYRIKRKDGEWIWLHDRATVVYEENGIKYADGVFADITEQKELEKQRLESNNRLQRLAQKLTIAGDELKVAIETKGEFMNIAAHELRTPLQPIIGYADRLLQERNPTDWQKERLNIILDNAKRLLKLVQDLLDINKMETGIMKFAMAEVDLLAIIKEIYQSFKPVVEAKKLKFILDISETPGPIKVEGDSNKLNQVFSNLIDNAIKFTDKGGIAIQVKEGKNTATVNFKDTGSGIDKKYMPQLFTKFFQVDATDKREVSGTGLGLAICKEIIKAHKGKISVQSTLGKGSTFQVILPKLTRPTKRKGVENGQNFGNRR